MAPSFYSHKSDIGLGSNTRSNVKTFPKVLLIYLPVQIALVRLRMLIRIRYKGTHPTFILSRQAEVQIQRLDAIIQG